MKRKETCDGLKSLVHASFGMRIIVRLSLCFFFIQIFQNNSIKQKVVRKGIYFQSDTAMHFYNNWSLENSNAKLIMLWAKKTYMLVIRYFTHIIIIQRYYKTYYSIYIISF